VPLVSLTRATNDFNKYEFSADVFSSTAVPGGLGTQGSLQRARITLPPPRPLCWLTATPGSVKAGAPLNFSVITTQGVNAISVTGPGLNWTPPKQGGSIGIVAPTAASYPITANYVGVVTGIPGVPAPFNTATCSASVVVETPCRWLDPAYFMYVNVPTIGMAPLGMGGPAPWTERVISGSRCASTTGATASDICLQIRYGPCPGDLCNYYMARVNNYLSASCTVFFPYQVRVYSCFSPETRLRTKSGKWKRADAIVQGDSLWNPATGNGMRVYRIIGGEEAIPLYELGYGQHRVKVTSTHPIFTRTGLKQARSLTLGDEVLGDDGDFHILTLVRRARFKAGQRVINFELDSYRSREPRAHMIDAEGFAMGDYTLQNILDGRASDFLIPERERP